MKPPQTFWFSRGVVAEPLHDLVPNDLPGLAGISEAQTLYRCGFT
jgi:hypothetical protein